jgi:REP element-mobilizing transposase RayT
MAEPAPIYTGANCRFAHPLSWALTVFWRDHVEPGAWFEPLNDALAPDGIRLARMRTTGPATSQFLATSLPGVPPSRIVQRVKGRLQHLIRDRQPKALRRHFAIRSVGKVKREVVQAYVASQLDHHPMADARVAQRFEGYQISRADVDLAARRQTTHGVFWHVLHVVLVHAERWREIREARVQAVRSMMLKVCEKKGYVLREAGILPDHLHLLLGCGFEDAPGDVALCFLNNLAFALGMQPVFQFGGFVGTVGEYDLGAVRGETSPHLGKQGGGGPSRGSAL